MIERIDTATEQKLISCAERMITLVNTKAEEPTAALVKVASENDLNPHQVRRVAEAYNTSKSLANHRQKQAEARCEPFTLAFADQALKELFPKNVVSTGEQVVINTCRRLRV
jgi:hypothetical protein